MEINARCKPKIASPSWTTCFSFEPDLCRSFSHKVRFQDFKGASRYKFIKQTTSDVANNNKQTNKTEKLMGGLKVMTLSLCGLVSIKFLPSTVLCSSVITAMVVAEQVGRLQ